MKKKFHINLKFLVYALVSVILVLLGTIFFLSVGRRPSPVTPTTPSSTPTNPLPLQSQTSTEFTSTSTAEYTPTQTSTQTDSDFLDGLWLTSFFEGGFYRIAAFHPHYLAFTPLFSVPWDELEPSLSPDGTRMAYRSNQSGFWDIYVRDLATGDAINITNTSQYDGAPSWSPDGQWIVYETYLNDNFDLYIQSIADLTADPVQLTFDSADDHSPSWSPLGREIVYVSNSTGNNDLWMARFDYYEDERFINLTNTPDLVESHPHFSNAGTLIVFSLESSGYVFLSTLDLEHASTSKVGQCLDGMWKYDDTEMICEVRYPNSFASTVFSVDTHHAVQPLFDLPSKLYGLQWLTPAQSENLWFPIQEFLSTNESMPATASGTPQARDAIVKLDNVSAPYAYIASSVYQPFIDLRGRVGHSSGWDFLANLDSAYTPITEPPDLGLPQNWLYTGRAIALNTLPLQADWMVLQRELIDGQIYWRVWIKALKQDGSAGTPMKDPIWDLDARYSGSTVSYENGGENAEPPDGYWIDVTAQALEMGWMRLPALTSWRTYYSAARFNLLVYQATDDWTQSMLRIYPPEALATYTPLPTIAPLGAMMKTPTRTTTVAPSPTKNP